MRPLWKGLISFGLVNIPVRLYAATEKKDVSFRLLHRECNTPVRYLRWCPKCERELQIDEIVRGFELDKGSFVIVTDEELEGLPGIETRVIRLISFVEARKVDPIYFEKSYFLEPAEGGSRAYRLLAHALAETDRLGLAKVAIRNKETLAAVRNYSGTHLAMESMFFAEEVRSVRELALGPEGVPEAKEVEMARILIKTLETDFKPEEYRSEYREALRRLIERKSAGERVEPEQVPEATKVVDLMKALQDSIRAAAESSEEAKRKRVAP